MSLSKNNKFREFGKNSNKLTDEQYDQLPDRQNGNKPGEIASASLNNTAIHQTSLLATAIAEFISSKLPSQQIDSTLSVEELTGFIDNAIKGMIPTKLGQLENDKGYNSVTIYSGDVEPSPSLGKSGDLYVKFSK